MGRALLFDHSIGLHTFAVDLQIIDFGDVIHSDSYRTILDTNLILTMFPDCMFAICSTHSPPLTFSSNFRHLCRLNWCYIGCRYRTLDCGSPKIRQDAESQSCNRRSRFLPPRLSCYSSLILGAPKRATSCSTVMRRFSPNL